MRSIIKIAMPLYGVKAQAVLKEVIALSEETKAESLQNPNVDADYELAFDENKETLYFKGDRRVFQNVCRPAIEFYKRHSLNPVIYLGDHSEDLAWDQTYEHWIRNDATLEKVLEYFRSEDQKYRPIHYSKVEAVKPLLDVIHALRDMQNGVRNHTALDGYNLKELKLANSVIEAYWFNR